QTLEIGNNGNLTIDAAEAVSRDSMQLDGGNAAITDNANIVLSADANLIGAGNVNANVSGDDNGNGTITANNGTLVLSGNVINNANSSLTLAIGSTTASDVKINSNNAGTNQATVINSVNQTLEIGNNGNLTI